MPWLESISCDTQDKMTVIIMVMVFLLDGKYSLLKENEGIVVSFLITHGYHNLQHLSSLGDWPSDSCNMSRRCWLVPLSQPR